MAVRVKGDRPYSSIRDMVESKEGQSSHALPSAKTAGGSRGAKRTAWDIKKRRRARFAFLHT